MLWSGALAAIGHAICKDNTTCICKDKTIGGTQKAKKQKKKKIKHCQHY